MFLHHISVLFGARYNLICVDMLPECWMKQNETKRTEKKLLFLVKIVSSRDRIHMQKASLVEMLESVWSEAFFSWIERDERSNSAGKCCDCLEPLWCQARQLIPA